MFVFMYINERLSEYIYIYVYCFFAPFCIIINLGGEKGNKKTQA